MAMAYLSDPRHAASILLYYIVIIFAEFGLLELTFRSICFRGEKELYCFKEEYKCKECICYFKDERYCRCILATSMVFALLVLIYGLSIAATIFFYLIPVRESIGKAPSQVVVTYNTAFILVGGYIIYKVIIKKQNSLQRAIRECYGEWKSMPDHELLKRFYRKVIEELIINKSKNRNHTSEQEDTKDELKKGAPQPCSTLDHEVNDSSQEACSHH